MPASSLSSASVTATTQLHAETPRPIRDPACERCRYPSRTPFKVDPDNYVWEVGDIVMLNESIHLPVDSLLGNRIRSRRQSTGPSSMGGSTRGKERSAIVWEIVSEGYVRYVMMASYEGLHTHDSLPDILKNHFAVPVSPHCEIRPEDSHVHTDPEWQARNIWLVAIPFASDGQVASRWGWKDVHRVRQNDRGFTIEESVWIQLQDTIESRLAEWGEACRSRRGYLRKCKEEYNTFKNPMMWAQLLAERAREAAAAHADQMTPEEGVLKQEVTSGDNTAGNEAGGSTPPGDTSSTIHPSEATLAGSASDASKKDATGTPVTHRGVQSTEGNGGAPRDDDGAGNWNEVVHKKANKLKKNHERQRTVSGLGSMLGGLLGRKTQSHK
ncbi:hypothetical protein C8T65DRAFT_743186 [Cerioporus squamosus]|nr:hypothetical protein C8T65DRAFT_743186 [Cerioporus squamosus]